MYSKEKINSAVKHLLEQCVNQMHTLYQEEEITDFYIHVDPGSGEMRIVDDNDTLLSREAIPSDLQERLLIYQVLWDYLWSQWTVIKEAKGDDFGGYGRMRYERAMKNLQLI